MEAILKRAREQSVLSPVEVAEYVCRGKERVARLQEYMQEEKKIGGAPDPRLYELSRVQAYAFAQQVSHAGPNYKSPLDMFNDPLGMDEMLVAGIHFQYPGSVGSIMTLNLIKNTGSEEQKKLWVDKIVKHVWKACYAQTEISGGSDVQNLQTLAVYDPKTKEFEFHNPTIDSIKWWPGDLGLASSHAAVFARLITNGKDHGVQAFFVEIRDPLTHIPRKGVEVGDIGPKLGYKIKDNGFLRFTRFRAPKLALLSRFISIDNEGKVSRQGNPKMMYTAMMRMRTGILIGTYSGIFKAVTIATRYSLYRTQFKDSKGQPIHIYEYQMQREKLFKEISRAYLMCAATHTILLQLGKGEILAEKDDFTELQNSHIMLCSFKAFFTWWMADSLSNLIKACGGHGYSMFSGIPQILMDEFPNQIGEGENTVLLIQVGRQLLKCLSQIQRGDSTKVTGPFSFLVESEKWNQGEMKEGEPITRDVIVGMFKKTVCKLLQKVGIRMFGLIQQYKDAKMVMDTMVSTELQKVSRVFSVCLILESAQQTLERVKMSKGLGEVLRDLFLLSGINLVEEYASPLLEAGALTSANVEQLNERRLQLLDELKPHGLVLAEGMQWDDAFLASAIGSKDKEPYETLYSWAKELGQLNQFDNQIHPAVQEFQLKVSRMREEKL